MNSMHPIPRQVEDDRCASVGPDGYRCQLFTHDDDQHAAKVYIRGFLTWGAEWTGPPPGEAPIAWAGSFPRIEGS